MTLYSRSETTFWSFTSTSVAARAGGAMASVDEDAEEAVDGGDGMVLGGGDGGGGSSERSGGCDVVGAHWRPP